jgi:hypothetical protein
MKLGFIVMIKTAEALRTAQKTGKPEDWKRYSELRSLLPFKERRRC